MEFYTFNLRPFKSVFYTILTILIAMTLATFILGSNLVGIVFIRGIILPLTRTIFYLTVGSTIFMILFQKSLLKKLDNISNFGEKADHYLKIYKFRLYWMCGNCFFACFSHFLTGHNTYIFLAIFDILITLPLFPNAMLIRKELKTEDISFVED